MKRKHTVIYAVICIICGVLLIASACNAAAGGVSAAAVDSTVTLTHAQTIALFGQSISIEYYSTDGTYKTATANYDGYVNYISNSVSGAYYDPDGFSAKGRGFCNYSCPMPSDFAVSPAASVSVLFKTAVDISSLTYFDSAILTYNNIDLASQLYGTYVNYWHCSDGDHYAARQGAANTPEYNYYGYVVDTYSQRDIVTPCIYTSASNTKFSTGWANIGTFGSVDRIQIGIVCPIISENWVFDGNTGAGSGSSSGGDSSGGGSDMSGVESRLDTIISKLDAIISEMNDDDDSSSGETTTPPGGDPDEPFGTEPADFDYDAAAAAAQPAYDMPFLAPADTPTGGSGMAIQDGGGIAPPESVNPVDVSSDSISSGIGLLWYLLQSVLNVVPVYSRLIMANLAISIAIYFIFRGGSD